MKETDKILENEWAELLKGIKIGQHPFHTFNFSTISNDLPSIRTVVLRKANSKSNEISFHTDNRSSKYHEVLANNKVCSLFYDRKRKVQLRMYGKAYIDQDNSQSSISWKRMTNESKICYMGPYAPSTMINDFEPNLPKILPHQINQKYENLGYKNFCIINISIARIDWLYLDHKGHKRLLFYFGNNVKANWIAS